MKSKVCELIRRDLCVRSFNFGLVDCSVRAGFVVYCRQSILIDRCIYVCIVVSRCLVPTQKLYTPSHRMFGDMHGALNIDKNN
jgi:hypothetical protein